MPTPPRIYTTTEWGARVVTNHFEKNAAKGIVIHNTEDPNRAPLAGSAEEKKAASVAKAIQNHHMDDNGWSDTGQHFTISRGGLILEGRTGSAGAARAGQVVRGAHGSGVTSVNKTFFGIEMEGDNRGSYQLTDAQWDSMVELCAWLCKWSGLGVTASTLIGHKDILAGHTDCPGHLHDKLGQLRTEVSARLAEINDTKAKDKKPLKATKSEALEEIAKVEDSSGRTVKVRRVKGETAFFYLSAMSVDADGSPRAYHPDDYPKDHHIGLDNPAHAGRPGNWWALATKDGNPVVQGAKDPAPGYWVSMTALSSGPETDPKSYVDAEVIPYFVMPNKLGGAKRGDFGIIYHKESGKYTGAIFADTNPAVGESSIAAAALLGVSADARAGGTSSAIIGYLVFPGSGNGRPRSLSEVLDKAGQLFDEWGGPTRLKGLLG